MLVLLSEEYELDRPTARRLCHCVCQQLCSESMVRGFLVGFLRNLNLELEDEELRQTLARSRQPYLVDHCPIRLETFVKQYHALADDAYLRSLTQLAHGRPPAPPPLWPALAALSKQDAPSLDHYLRVRPS